jgi:phosphatidylglycerophosphate synthase
MARLLNGARAEDLLEGAECFIAGAPREVTWRILQASMKAGEGWVGRHINRPISFRLAALAMRLGITPNPVTWLTFLIAVAMAGLLALGGTMGLAIGGALYQVVSVIDCVDGDIARVSYMSSRKGAALDTTLDMIANLGFMGGLGAGLVLTYGTGQLLAAGLLVAVAACAMLFMTMLLRIGPKRGSFDVLRAALEQRLSGTPRLRGAVMTVEKMFKRDFYALFFATLCLLGLARVLLWLALAGSVVWLLAIAWCAPLIARDKQGALLPSHLRGI